MTDPDLMELAELWQRPDAAAQQQFEAAALRVKRQARFLAYTDVAFGAMIILSMVLGFILKPEPLSAGIAVLVIAAILWLNWKRRALRQMSRTLDTSDRKSFIASSVRNANANLRRVTLSLYLFPMLAALVVASKLGARQGGHLDHPIEILAQWVVSPRGLFVIATVALIVAVFLRSRRKYLVELRRLEKLDLDYNTGDRLDADAT